MTDFTTWERESLISFCSNATKEVTKLRAELDKLKRDAPAYKPAPLKKAEPLNPPSSEFWKMDFETDEEFAAKGKPYVEVIE